MGEYQRVLLQWRRARNSISLLCLSDDAGLVVKSQPTEDWIIVSERQLNIAWYDGGDSDTLLCSVCVSLIGNVILPSLFILTVALCLPGRLFPVVLRGVCRVPVYLFVWPCPTQHTASQLSVGSVFHQLSLSFYCGELQSYASLVLLWVTCNIDIAQ